MATSDGGPIFCKAIDGLAKYKDRHYIANLIMATIDEPGTQKCIPYWINLSLDILDSIASRLVHTLNLALKNICATKIQ